MNTTSFTKLFSVAASKFSLGANSGDVISPRRDWLVILGIFFLLNIASVTWALFVFFEVRSGDMFRQSPGGVVQTQTLDTEKLSSVLDAYYLKRAKFEQGDTGTTLKDPSK